MDDNKFVAPDGYNENEVINIVNNILNMLAHKFVFGYFDIDDIRQHGYMEAVKALPDYVPKIENGKVTQPLEKFLYTHIYNRLLNLRRDKYRRSDPPCNLCHCGRESEHNGGMICKRYADWRKRNHQKSNLVSSDKSIENYDSFPMKNYDSPEQVLILQESLELIDRHLPAELRSAYLKMRAQVYVPKVKRIKVMNVVREILNVNN